jgi:hypothetical protein
MFQPKHGQKNATLHTGSTLTTPTVKLIIIDNYPTKSIKDISDPWGKKFISLAGKNTVLGIENEILRKMDEPRIHFAINCASVSCPNLLNEALHTEAKLEQQLKAVSISFINDKKYYKRK